MKIWPVIVIGGLVGGWFFLRQRLGDTMREFAQLPTPTPYTREQCRMIQEAARQEPTPSMVDGARSCREYYA